MYTLYILYKHTCAYPYAHTQNCIILLFSLIALNNNANVPQIVSQNII